MSDNLSIFCLFDHLVSHCCNLFVMVICAVETCNSRSGRDKKIAFFSKKLDLRRIWISKWQRIYLVFQSVKTSNYVKSTFLREILF